jgi:hypothetical protein
MRYVYQAQLHGFMLRIYQFRLCSAASMKRRLPATIRRHLLFVENFHRSPRPTNRRSTLDVEFELLRLAMMIETNRQIGADDNCDSIVRIEARANQLLYALKFSSAHDAAKGFHYPVRSLQTYIDALGLDGAQPA